MTVVSVTSVDWDNKDGRRKLLVLVHFNFHSSLLFPAPSSKVVV